MSKDRYYGDQIIAAIDKVAGISQETLALLKELVSESFTRPYLSEGDDSG